MKPAANTNDTKRITILGVGLLVIVTLLILQVQNFNAPQNTITIPVPSVPSSDPALPVAGAFESIVPPSGPGVADPDPFRPVLTRRGPANVVIPPIDEPLAPPTQITGTPPKPVNPGTTPGVIAVRPPNPKLTGVLLGDRPLAVLEVNGQSQMASLGDRLPGGFRVIAITEKTVQLAFGKEVVTLTLGE